MRSAVRNIIFLALLLGLNALIFAQSGGNSAGLTLLQGNSPRPSALGDAFSAVTNDIAALNFNPASLATLNGSQLALQHKQGIFEDAFNQLAVGSQIGGGALGLSVGIFDSGNAELYDGATAKSVTAQKDYLVSLGYGGNWAKFDLGGSIRYLSSELAEDTKASGSTGEFGLQYPITSNFRVGASGTVFATSLNYSGQSESLPKTYRVGASLKSSVPMGSRPRLPILLLGDVPYSSEDKEFLPSVGLEILVAEPLAIRTGYKFNQGVQGFTVGFGFLVRNFSVDYSFGMVSENQLDSLHTLGISLRIDKGILP